MTKKDTAKEILMITMQIQKDVSKLKKTLDKNNKKLIIILDKIERQIERRASVK